MAAQTKESMLDVFDGSTSFAAAHLRVTEEWIKKLPDGELNDNMLMRVRDYFLRTTGRVPRDWMPAKSP